MNIVQIFKNQIMETIKVDSDLKKLLKFYTSEKDFINFTCRLTRYSLQLGFGK